MVCLPLFPVYEDVSVICSVLVKDQDASRLRPYVDLPPRGSKNISSTIPSVSTSSSLSSHLLTRPSISNSHPASRFLSKLGHLAESNFVTHVTTSHSHLPAVAQPGPSRFPGAYQDDSRPSKRSRK